jgi:hypothetical protein
LYEDYRRTCESFGWKIRYKDVPQLWRSCMEFDIPGTDLFFRATLTRGVVNCGILPILFWEGYDLHNYPEEAQYRRARGDYDRKYAHALEQVVQALGPPARRWVDLDAYWTGKADVYRQQKAVWQGKTCLLALQQDDHDIQLGFDINFLLQPSKGKLPKKLKLIV